jgi:arsenate reductase (thioredoxin)
MNSPQKQHLLFVCVENSNRSQMAEAFARLHGGNDVEAHSAGSRPSGKVNPKAVAAMKEKGVDLSLHTSKGLTELPDVQWDWVVTMGCGDECPFLQARHRDDWPLPDPRNMEGNEFNKVRDEIEQRVLALLETLKKEKIQ